MSRQKCWWSQLQPQPEHSLLEQAPLLIAGPFSLSSIRTLAALLGCCAFSSILSCWHSTRWKSFRVLTDNESLPHSAKLVAAWPPSLCHQRKVFPPFVLLAQGSTPSWLIIGSFSASCKPLPLYEQIQEVLTRLYAVLVKSLRADHSGASLPWAGSQLISKVIIKCWSPPDGQPPSHPWGAAKNIVFLGSLPVLLTTYPQQMLIWLLFVL